MQRAYLHCFSVRQQINPYLLPFRSPSFSPPPFLKHSSHAQAPFRASSSPSIMSASLHPAAEAIVRPPRLQPSPSLPNLRCVQVSLFNSPSLPRNPACATFLQTLSLRVYNQLLLHLKSHPLTPQNYRQTFPRKTLTSTQTNAPIGSPKTTTI